MAAKPGVQSTLLLSKTDGSIIRSSGLLARASPPSLGSTVTNSAASNGSGNVDIADSVGLGYYDVDSKETSKEKRAEDVAKMVFSFVSSAGTLVEGMDEGDEVRLLRIRTRKSEIVIFPGQYLQDHYAHQPLHIFS